MKWLLVVGYFLIVPGENAPDVQLKIYPDTFKTLQECQFMKELIRNKYSEYQSTAIECYGVGTTW